MQKTTGKISLPLRVIRTALLTYLAVIGFLYFWQRRLQYQPVAESPAIPQTYAQGGLTNVELVAEDGVELQAWFWPAEGPGTIALFHGNAGHRGDRLGWMHALHDLGWSVFLLDYRGYGGSAGAPSETGLYRDAEAAWSWLRANTEGRLVLLGASLGGGVAVELARRHPPDGLILQSTFTSAVDVAAAIYPFLPVRWLLKDRYVSVEKIGSVTCPLLAIHGEEDRIVAHRFGRRLFETAAEPKQWLSVPKAGHNDLLEVAGESYWQQVTQFLESVATPR